MGVRGVSEEMARLQRFLTKIYVALIASHLPPHPPPSPPTPSWCKSFRLSPAGGRNMAAICRYFNQLWEEIPHGAATLLLLGASRVFFRRSFHGVKLLRPHQTSGATARSQVSTWALSLKDSSLRRLSPEVNLRVCCCFSTRA